MSVNQSSSLFFLARPDQSLQMHIKNMLAEVIKFINKNKYIVHLNDPQKQKELLDVFYKTLVISHDFGKINPYFQRKIKGKILENKKLTYHSQIGGLLSIIILKMLEDCMGDDEVLKETRIHLTAITYAILNHHNRGILPNNPLVGIMKFGTEFRYKDLFKIIQEILEYSSTSRTSVDILIDYFTELKINNVLLEKVISLAIEKFLNISNDEEIEDYFYDFEERWNNVRSDNRLFHLILHYYSILCDLDEWDAKSHIENSENHMISFENDYYKIKGDIVSNYRVSEFKPIHEDTKDPLLKLKQKLWEEVNSVLENRITKNRIFSITYPTGSGKTISFLHLALMLRARLEKEHGENARVIYCLPFISITDQVAAEITKIFIQYFGKEKIKDNSQSDLLSIHHHLAEAEWSYFGKEEKDEINFGKLSDYIYLWNSNFIVTTFVSFWNSFFGGRKRNLLRLHRINNSIIILDEIQNIPIKYWELISSFLQQLCRLTNCTVIIGSATNPKALTSNIGWNKYPTEIEEIKHQYEDSELNRYSINYFAERINLSKFALESVEFLRNNNTKSVMFVLNTKESARLLFDYIKDNFSCENVYFLSSAVTHKDRKKILSKIFERKEKRILICTQVIEAGVDITFDVVFRDLAPLDSIVQVAGRCNRYNEEKGEVNIVELTKPESENLVYCTMVYDPILIEQTRFILKKTKKIDEIRLSSVIEKYYEILTNEGNRKDTKRAVEEYNNLFFESLSEEFKLIDEQENDTLIICKNSAEMIKLISKADMMNRKDIFTEFRVKAISMSKRAIERIKEKVSSTSITIIIDSDYASIWAVSLEENNWLYQENGGLNIPELNDTTPLQKLD